MNPALHLTPGARATLACIWEASAPKAGNVYPGQSFTNLSVHDFYLAAIALGQTIDATIHESCGKTIYEAVSASKCITQSNANLGMVLLLVPLAKASQQYPELSLRNGLAQVLKNLTQADTSAVYDAIRIANPGGLGEVDQGDIHAHAPNSLLEAMGYASEHDSIAKCYITDFESIFDFVAPTLARCYKQSNDWFHAITETQLHVLQAIPDTLIARKVGREIAAQISHAATEILNHNAVGEREAHWRTFDGYLRSQGNQLNPGTTADLIAAGLYVLFS